MGDATGTVHRQAVAALLLVALAVIWGVHWVVAKWGLDYFPPFSYATLRVATGLATVVVLLGLRGRLARPARQDLPVILSVGLGQVAAGAALMNVALQYAPAGRSAILVYSMPLWVAVLQSVFLHLVPARLELLGLAFGMAGVAALVNPGAIDWTAPGELWSAAMLLISAATWGATSIHVRRHRWRSSPLALQPWQLAVALVPLAALALAAEQGAAIRWEPGTAAVLLYSGPLATAFAFWASQSITRSLGPLAATVGFLGVPVVGLAAGAVLLREPLTPLDFLAFCLTAGGVLLVTRSLGRGGGSAQVGSPGATVPDPALQSRPVAG